MRKIQLTGTRVSRKRKLEDQADLENALKEGAEHANEQAKKMRGEMYLAARCVTAHDVEFPESHICVPEPGGSKALNLLTLAMCRDLRRQIAEQQEEEDEFAELVEAHAKDKPIAASSGDVKSPDQVKASAWGVVGQKSTLLEVLKSQSRVQA